MPAMISGRTSVGRDERREAGVERPVEAEVHERELEAGADALQEVEAGAADLRAALHVDRVEQLAELEVVARLEVEARLARRPRAASTKSSSPPAGTPSMTMFWMRAGDLGEARLGLGSRPAAPPSPAAASSCAWATSAAFSSFGAAATVLPKAFCSARRFSNAVIADAPAGVGGDRLVDEADGCAAQLLRAPDDVGVLAQQLRVDHAVQSIRGACHGYRWTP